MESAPEARAASLQLPGQESDEQSPQCPERDAHQVLKVAPTQGSLEPCSPQNKAESKEALGFLMELCPVSAEMERWRVSIASGPGIIGHFLALTGALACEQENP